MATLLRKAKNTKWPIYNCVFISIEVSWVLSITLCKNLPTDSQEVDQHELSITLCTSLPTDSQEVDQHE
jgi:hypothetical protein